MYLSCRPWVYFFGYICLFMYEYTWDIVVYKYCNNGYHLHIHHVLNTVLQLYMHYLIFIITLWNRALSRFTDENNRLRQVKILPKIIQLISGIVGIQTVLIDPRAYILNLTLPKCLTYVCYGILLCIMCTFLLKFVREK